MNSTDDWQLLRDYTQRNSEEAFRTLVDRYAGLVYHAALRQSGNPQTAQDVAQAVFIALARKAGRFPRGTVLSGWLFRATRFAFANLAREESRRQHREQEAVMMQDSLRPDETESVWKQISPLLDDALDRLSAKDREAILLRFFQDKTHREVARLLGISEDATKVRVSRALEKLRLIFAARGIATPSAVLLAVFAAHGAQVAPAGLTAAVAGAAVAKGTIGTTSTLTLVKGVLQLMAWTKAKTAIVIGAGVLLAAGTATVTIKEIRAYSTDESWRVLNLNSQIVEKAAPQVRILPTKFAGSGGAASYTDYKFAALDKSVDDIARIAYDVPPGRVIFATTQPQGGYDYIANLPQGSRQALQRELKKQFGLTGRLEMRAMDSLLLRVRNPNAPGLKPPTGGPGFLNDRVERGLNYVTCNNLSLSSIRNLLEQRLNQPVIDEIGLTQHFSFELQWNGLNGRNADHSNLKQALLEQLGLELVPTNTLVEMLVLEE